MRTSTTTVNVAIAIGLSIACGVSLPITTARAETPVRDAAQSNDDQRRELAHLVKTLLEMQRDGIPDTGRKVDGRIGEILDAFGVEAEQEAIALIEDALEEFAPEALPLLHEHEAAKPGDETRGRLHSLQAALELYMIEQGRYPSAAEGLSALLVGGASGPYIDAYMVRDGWGNVILYKANDEYSYELRSSGADGKPGTADDVVTDEQGGAFGDGDAKRDTGAREEVVATLSDGDVPEAVQLAPQRASGAGGVTYRIKRDGKQFVVVDDKAHQPFDLVSLPRFSPEGNVVMYTAATGDENFMVINGTRHAIGKPIFSGCRFVEETDIFGTPAMEPRDGPVWHIGNGDWLATTADGYHDPRADEPVFDDDKRCLAVRVRHGDTWGVHDKWETSAPYAWVSQPIAVPGGGAVMYRTWSPDGTRVVIEGMVAGEHDWARDPVFNESTSLIAYAINEGGSPVRGFERVRESHGKDWLGNKRGWSKRAYEGGTYHIVVDDQIGPAFAFVEDPVFGPDDTTVAYRAQREDGTWVAVFGDQVSGGFERIRSLTFDRPTSSLAFIASRGESDFVVLGESRWPPFANVEHLAGGGAGNFAFVVTDDEGKKHLVVNTTSYGPYNDVDAVGFLGDGTTAFARVTVVSEHQAVVVGSTLAAYFDAVTEPVAATDSNAIVYAGRSGETWHMVVGNEIGPAFTAVAEPQILADGTVIYVATVGGEATVYGDTYPTSHGGTQHVVVDHVAGDGYEFVSAPTVSPDRTRAFVQAYTEDGDAILIVIGGHAPGPQRADDASFDADGRLTYVEESKHGARLVTDGVAGPMFDTVSVVRVDVDSAPLTCEVEYEGKRQYLVGDWIGPAFEFITDPVFGPDGETLAFRARDGESWHLVVGRWVSPAYDSVFEPVFSADGRTVDCAALRGRELLRVSVDVDRAGGG